jgi:hypothetical protein
VKVIQRLVHLLDSAKRPFHLTFGARGDAASILTRRHVGLPNDPQHIHDVLEYPAFGHGATVHIEHSRDALERKLRHVGFGRHSIEQKPQRRFGILAVDTAIFLVTYTAPVIHYAEQHQGWCTSPRLDPQWGIHLLEIGGGHIELPACVAELGLKPHRRQLPGQSGLIEFPAVQVFVHCGSAQQSLGGTNQALRGFHAIVFDQLDGTAGGQMPTLFVGRA